MIIGIERFSVTASATELEALSEALRIVIAGEANPEPDDERLSTETVELMRGMKEEIDAAIDLS